ncbi:receptor-like serine/threonine-protein kinase At4g25390 [Diospyros lotus]|uniref:receptor-like serine/threonine-protein kinase At4g25390 n=1 Tax=Diospyros lotus TaxID=55363 RepID=UPI00225470FA|nr:receptor-like serine/threonine-protein kinase At4g25390 [Diospyros lotus]
MPSRQIPPPPHSGYQNHRLPPVAGGVAASFSLLILFSLCFPKLKRAVPSDSKSPRQLSYSALRLATSSFSASRRLGRGGFGSVYRGTLDNQELAVKVMDSGSLQGEREFQNELLFAGKLDSDRIVSVVGFSMDRKRRRMLLAYELMNNGSLQDCLLHRKCAQLKEWKKRFAIAIDVAKALEYLHHYCDPPVVHGDIKPSNVLLDQDFNAKIGDFGLARLKSDDQCEVAVQNGGVEETESVATTTPESFLKLEVPGTSPEIRVEVSPETVKAAASPSSDLAGASPTTEDLEKANAPESRENDGAELRIVKDYVMEWIGSEVKNERPKIEEWIGVSSSSGVVGKSGTKKNKKRLDWWKMLDEEKTVKKEKRRPAREWWKEEYCEELARKNKKKKKQEGSAGDGNNTENWWPVDETLYVDGKKKKRTRSRSSFGSLDWWLEGLGGELRKARLNSHDSASGVSSTPSMRGTVCYIAPEYGGGGELSEKCDVYSFGVLLLVLIAGRRPLQVTGSPKSRFHRANLLSWARHLARAGKLLDLVDQSVHSLDREQALLCITVALLCLQKLPTRRPSMKKVLGMLSGELEFPQLPVELSPAPPSRIPLKSLKRVR